MYKKFYTTLKYPNSVCAFSHTAANIPYHISLLNTPASPNLFRHKLMYGTDRCRKYACPKATCNALAQQCLQFTEVSTTICLCTSTHDFDICLQLPSAIQPPATHSLKQSTGHALCIVSFPYRVNAGAYSRKAAFCKPQPHTTRHNTPIRLWSGSDVIPDMATAIVICRDPARINTKIWPTNKMPCLCLSS